MGHDEPPRSVQIIVVAQPLGEVSFFVGGEHGYLVRGIDVGFDAGQAASGGPVGWALEMTLAEGANTLVAQVTDLAGNTGQHSVDFAYRTDLDQGGIINNVDRIPKSLSAEFSDQYTEGLGESSIYLVVHPDPAASRLYAANFASGSVSVIDTTTLEVMSDIPLGGKPVKLVISPDGQRVYVNNYDTGVVHVIDTTTNSGLTRIDVAGQRAYATAISPDGARLYTADYYMHRLSMIHTSNNRVVGGIDWSISWPFRGPLALAVSNDGSRLYATFENGYAISSRASDLSGVKYIKVLPGLYGLAVRPGNGDVWVASRCYGSNSEGKHWGMDAQLNLQYQK